MFKTREAIHICSCMLSVPETGNTFLLVVQRAKCAYLKSEPTLLPFSGIPGSGHVSDAIASPPWVTAK